MGRKQHNTLPDLKFAGFVGTELDTTNCPSRPEVFICTVSVGVKNVQADTERDGRTCLARPNSQARTGTGTNIFSPLFS